MSLNFAKNANDLNGALIRVRWCLLAQWEAGVLDSDYRT